MSDFAITTAGEKAMAVPADVSVEEEVQQMFAGVSNVLGPIDILVANSGSQQDAPLVGKTVFVDGGMAP